MAQQALINIEAEDEAEGAAEEAESVPELVDRLSEVDATVMELTVGDENTDEQMNGTVLENWEDVDMEAV